MAPNPTAEPAAPETTALPALLHPARNTAPLSGAIQGLITNTYLSPTEYDVLASLRAALLSKTRFSVPPLGVDVFDCRLQGLVLGEAEFATDEEAQSFVPPSGCMAELTDDARFTGGRLVQASRQELPGGLAEYGIRPEG